MPRLIGGTKTGSDFRQTGERSAPLLEVKALHVSAGKTKILDGVDFALSPGSVTGVLGQSGCGKTTTALAIMRLLPVSTSCAGAIYYSGRDILGLPEKRMREMRGRQIAMIFQEPGLALNPVMRVGNQVMEVMRAHLPWDRERRRHETRQLFDELELESVDRVFSSYPHQLSGGQCQRVLIAQALAAAPNLIIADEPTASLDAIVQAEIMALLRRVHRLKKTAMLFITHDPALLAGFAEHVLVMDSGKIVESGTTDAVFRAPTHPFTRAIVQVVEKRVAWTTA
jgi:peptide/nickel transport system ATP-binding protein